MAETKSIVRTKDIETVIHQNDETEGDHHGRLAKSLSAWDLMGFGIGIVIGTGIFTLTGVEAKNHAGPAIALSFAIAGIVSMLAALCYAELAAAVPTAGSSYTYAYTTIGEIFAWIIAWDLILEFALGAAVVSRGWSGYLQDLFNLPQAFFGEENSMVNLGAVAIALVLGTIAAVGIRESKLVTNALVVIKVSVCVFVIAFGVFFIKAAHLVPWIPPSQPGKATSGLKQPLWQWVSGIEPASFGVTGVFVAAAVVFFAYSGFEAVANLGEETKEPARDMPRGLIGTLVICTVLYLGVCVVLTGMVNYTDLSEGAPISDAFDQVGLGWASVLINIAAICGSELGDPGRHRRDGSDRLRSVPRRVAAAGGRSGARAVPHPVPDHASAPPRSCACSARSSRCTRWPRWSASAPCSRSSWWRSRWSVLRRTKPKMERPFRTPSVPWLPIASALTCLGLMASLAVETWLRFLVWLLIGLVVYFVYGRTHSRLAPGRSGAAVEEELGEGKIV